MTVPATILYYLVRASFDYKLEDGVKDLQNVSFRDWNETIKLSFEQGVAAITVDGLQKIVDANSDLELTIDSKDFEDQKYKWIGGVFQLECNYERYLSAAKALGKLYADNGLKTFVLKGLVFSECYPIPSQRSSSDLDCYFGNDYEKANLLAEQSGIIVNREYFKHSEFEYHGLHIENHHYFTAFRGSRKAKMYERLLQKAITSGESRPLVDSDLMAPPVMFSALFCISHAQTHFLTEGITLRHILDWALFRKRHCGEINWECFESVCKEYGMWQFAQTLTRIGLFLLCETDYSILSALDIRLLNDTLYGPREEKLSGMKRRVQLILKSFRSGWKYRYFSDQNVLEHVIQRVMGYFEKNITI